MPLQPHSSTTLWSSRYSSLGPSCFLSTTAEAALAAQGLCAQAVALTAPMLKQLISVAVQFPVQKKKKKRKKMTSPQKKKTPRKPQKTQQLSVLKCVCVYIYILFTGLLSYIKTGSAWKGEEGHEAESSDQGNYRPLN